jgi:hypothetical protein
MRPARDLQSARYARRLTEVVRLRPAHEENATRTPLIDIEARKAKSLTRRWEKFLGRSRQVATVGSAAASRKGWAAA